jgi:hypothetical protein
MLDDKPRQEPNKILKGNVPVTGDYRKNKGNPPIQKISTNGNNGDGRVLPWVLLDDGQGKSPSDMDISSSDNSAATGCVDARIFETDKTEHTLLHPPIIETTGRIATGATTPALRKQNKAQRNNILLSQPASSQWTLHHGKTLLPEDHWNDRKNAAEDREMSPHRVRGEPGSRGTNPGKFLAPHQHPPHT